MTDEAELSRYCVGIDLGTSNCAMCYVDTEVTQPIVETFPIPQWVDFGQRESRETLPSFLYELTPQEKSASHRLPWEEGHGKDSCGFAVGSFARDAAARHPGRRTSSAKSWLSHDGVDRTADLLPWHGDAGVTRLSPVEASSRYLDHLRSAWDEAHPDHPLDQQDVVITLPASFDEVARELTVTAAKKAGLRRVYLIEEPQAAFYAWIDRQADDWSSKVRPGQLILVCDIGGGTTDLTLIRVRRAGEQSDAGDEQVQFHRVAVGNHLILGGDNLDLAAAKLAESKIEAELSPSQWDRLVQVSRSVKEVMLGHDRPSTYTINLPSEGSRLVGGSIQVELTVGEIDQTLLDGFFPEVDLHEKAIVGSSGFQEFGLPYAADPAVTRHLAEFLSTHRRTGIEPEESDAADRPDLVLFNGGVMTSPMIRKRIVRQISNWMSESSAASWQPQVLEAPRLDLAVARGAAYYAMVRRGQGVRIAANLGRSYYMQVSENPPQGLCLIPGSAEAGQRFRDEAHPLELKIGTPVQFPLWVSSTRLADSVGQLVEIDRKEASPLPPICTALMQGKRTGGDTSLRVVIEAELSEIGTVALFCVDTESEKRWRLEFDIRSTLETDRDAHLGSGEASGIVDSETVDRCAQTINEVFGTATEKPNRLVKNLQSITETHRNQWPPSLLRDLWQSLHLHCEQGRRQSAQHEARWLNIVGFCLRPGYGVAVDDWRVGQVWKAIHGKLAYPAAASRTESMILWRRIAGGLTAGQQSQLAAPWISMLKNKTMRVEPHEAAEAWRLVGSLERLPVADKTDLGAVAIQALGQKKNESLRPAILWSIGRLGSRQPVYGPLNTTVPPSVVADWAKRVIASGPDPESVMWSLSLVQLGMLTGDRYRDLDAGVRSEISDVLCEHDSSQHLVSLLTQVGKLDRDEENAIFGDSLPLGIRLVR